MQADCTIIGAGSAGCVPANRLAEHPQTKSIADRGGGRDWNPLIHIPAEFFKMLDYDPLTSNSAPSPAPTAAPSFTRAAG